MLLNRGITNKDLTIANGAALSEAFNMDIHAGATILMPTAALKSQKPKPVLSEAEVSDIPHREEE
jgi:hypothetical protein